MSMAIAPLWFSIEHHSLNSDSALLVLNRLIHTFHNSIHFLRLMRHYDEKWQRAHLSTNQLFVCPIG